jgi:hypothetical protein
MPPLTAHLRFTSILAARGKIPARMDTFLLGCVAPDAFNPDVNSSFAQHHFSTESGGIELKAFQETTHLERLSTQSPALSFIYGYYAHLWLDIYFNEHGNELPVAKPLSILDAERKQAFRREVEFFDAPFILGLKNHLLVDFDSFTPPMGFEFVEITRCARRMKQLAEHAPALSQTALIPRILAQAGYADFMDKAAGIFLQSKLST